MTSLKGISSCRQKGTKLSAVRYPRGCEKSGALKEITGDYTVFEGVGDKAIVTYGEFSKCYRGAEGAARHNGH